jgi:hypothetical protein
VQSPPRVVLTSKHRLVDPSRSPCSPFSYNTRNRVGVCVPWRWCRRWPSTSWYSSATRPWARRPSSRASCTTSSTTHTRSVGHRFLQHLFFSPPPRRIAEFRSACSRRDVAGDDRDRLSVQDDVPRGPHRPPPALVQITLSKASPSVLNSHLDTRLCSLFLFDLSVNFP